MTCFYPTCEAKRLWTVEGDNAHSERRLSCIEHVSHAIAVDIVTNGESSKTYTIERTE